MAEKAINQAIAAKRVFPPMAEDFGAQLGMELPLKTRDFVRVVSNLLQSNDKVLKGAISKRKSEILGILAELVGALTDTQAVALPQWAFPKERKKVEAADNAEAADGALEKANVLAAAEAAAEKAAASADKKLADAIALIVERAAELTENQRSILLAALAEAPAEA